MIQPGRSPGSCLRTIGGMALLASILLHGAAFAVLSFGDFALEIEPSAEAGHMELLTVDIESATPFASGSPRPPCQPPEKPAPAIEPREATRLPRPHRSAPLIAPATESGLSATAPAVAQSQVESNAASDFEPGARGGAESGGRAGSGGNRGVVSGNAEGDGAIEQYGRMVHARIAAAVQYPESAAREGLQGSVALQIVVESDGRLRDVKVAGGIADGALQKAAVDAVRRAAPFPPLPSRTDAPAQAVQFRVPVRFFFPAP